jgi:hypothetical protein
VRRTNPAENAAGAVRAEKPRRKHRATGKPHGGRRIYTPGAPTENEHVYSPELAREIFRRMADGETLSAICKSRPEMPTPQTVIGWGERVEGFGEALKRARYFQAIAWGDQILEISDDGTKEPHDRRVRTDNRKWLMSKHAPQLYGDKLTVAGDPAAPLLHVHQLDDMLSSLSEPELAALERFAQERLRAQELRETGGEAIDLTGDVDSRERKRR